MGAASSKSEVYINSVIQAGVSAVNTTLSKAETRVTSAVEINFDHCEHVDISHLDFKQAVKMDLQSAASSLTSNELNQDVRDKVQAAAEAGAEAAIGFANADSKIIEDIVNKVTVAITNECSSISSGLANLLVSIHATYCGDAHLSYVNVNQRVEAIAKAISKSENMNAVKQDLIAEVEAIAKSKAKGWNISWIIMAVVALVFVFMFGGLEIVAKSVLSVSFWFLLGLAATGFGGYMCISSFTGTWPSKKIDKSKETPEDVKKKQDRNKSVLEWGSIITGIGAVVSLATGFVFTKQHAPKKVITQTQSIASPSQ